MENTDYLTTQLISYYGNKRKLLSLIAEGVGKAKSKLGNSKLRALDGFAGSGVVSRFLKRTCSLVVSNDLERYSETIARCYLTNATDVNVEWLDKTAAELEARKLRSDLEPGIMSRIYAPADDDDIQLGERGFFTTENARIIDNIRRTIDELVEEDKRHLFIAPLLAEASTHVNSPGHFGGFYKSTETGKAQFGGDKRDYLHRIIPQVVAKAPILSSYDCESLVTRQDTNQLIRELDPVDVAYFDPPYSRLIYGQFYFLLNVIDEYVESDDVTEVAGRPRDWNRSNYNSISGARSAISDLIDNVKASFVLLSYSNEGLIKHEELVDILQQRGSVEVISREHNSYKHGRKKPTRKPKTAERLYILEKSTG